MGAPAPGRRVGRDAGASAVAKARATGQLARLRTHDQVDRGIELLGEALELDRQAGLVADANPGLAVVADTRLAADVAVDINVTPDRGYALSIRGIARVLDRSARRAGLPMLMRSTSSRFV